MPYVIVLQDQVLLFIKASTAGVFIKQLIYGQEYIYP